MNDTTSARLKLILVEFPISLFNLVPANSTIIDSNQEQVPISIQN